MDLEKLQVIENLNSKWVYEWLLEISLSLSDLLDRRVGIVKMNERACSAKLQATIKGIGR